jgi:hypothetical protein
MGARCDNSLEAIMSVYEILARREKAEKLYLALARAGAELEQLPLMGDSEWAQAARAAGCHVPSVATRKLVVTLAEQRCAAASSIVGGGPTAEEEDAAAGYYDEDPMESHWRCQGGAR